MKIEINFFAYGTVEDLPVLSNAKKERKRKRSSFRAPGKSAAEKKERKNKKQ
jgi:hypothetical protein